MCSSQPSNSKGQVVIAISSGNMNSRGATSSLEILTTKCYRVDFVPFNRREAKECLKYHHSVFTIAQLKPLTGYDPLLLYKAVGERYLRIVRKHVFDVVIKFVNSNIKPQGNLSE